jgi:hypothetical protein
VDDIRTLEPLNEKMPRTLPWLTDAAKKKEGRKAGPSSSPKRKRASSDEEDLVDDDLNIIRPLTPERKPKKRANRTPSTSPPPAPPSVKYMREGYNADDAYLMVEDEFLSTAKMYTQHIHHAEYVRLKKLARSRGAGMLDAIARPTDGRTEQSTALRMKLEAAEKDEKIKNGIKQLGQEDESSEAEDEYMYDPQLAGLMTREKQARRDLSDLTKAKSNTRAAAGFMQSPHNVERKKDALALEDDVLTEDSDDLDRAPPRINRPNHTKVERSRNAYDEDYHKLGTGKQNTVANGSGIFKRYARPASGQHNDPMALQRTPPSKVSSNSTTKQSPRRESTEEMTPPRSTSEYLAKKRAEKERKEREEKRKAKKADEIPTFLI